MRYRNRWMNHLEERVMKQTGEIKRAIFLEIRYMNRWMIHLEERGMKQSG
jgi:hypothetical protein